MKTETLESRIINRIERERGEVFVRSDFADLGGYDQVGRVLRGLVRNGRLLKVSHGRYTRAAKWPCGDDPIPPNGLPTLKEALQRVGGEIVPTQMEREYCAGRTTWLPTGSVMGVRGCVRRKIGYDGINLSFEQSRERAEQKVPPIRETAQVILALAEKCGVAYTETASDAWAQNVTRLADDDVKLDAVELLLIELQRAGRLSRREALRLQANHLREVMP